MSKPETARETRLQEIESATQRPFRMLIDGKMREASSGVAFETWDPYTRQVLAAIPDASPDDVEAAVSAAARERSCPISVIPVKGGGARKSP